jgi:hypothetical protein
MGDKSGGKSWKNHKKHEDVIDDAVDVLNKHGVPAKPTQGNSPKGDIQIPKGDGDKAEKILKKHYGKKKKTSR